jgi:hypothetical protein
MATDQPNSNELTAILLRGHESKELDYKAPMAWSETDKASCCNLVKDILAMANTKGGFVVIGVSEEAGGFKYDGVSGEQAKSFDTTRLNRFLQIYADPPINALLRKIAHDGKTFVIIEIPAFPDTPHICQKDFPGILTAAVLYVRTDNNESAPIRSAADFQAVIERAVRNRGDSLLASFRSILTSGIQPPLPSAREQFLTQRMEAITRFDQLNPLKQEEPLLGYLEVSFLPERFDSARFTVDALRVAAERAHVTYTGWPFLFIHHSQPERTYVIRDGWETFIQTKDFGGAYLMDFWRLQQSGFFYYRTILRPSVGQFKGAPVPVADIRFIAVYIAEAVDCLTRLYDGLFEDSEYLTVEARLLNADGRALVSSWTGTMPLFADYLCRIPEIDTSLRLPLADWRAAVVDHALKMTNEIYLRFNWTQPNLDAVRDTMQRMFARKL